MEIYQTVDAKFSNVILIPHRTKSSLYLNNLVYIALSPIINTVFVDICSILLLHHEIPSSPNNNKYYHNS